jgi:hypothetical protein
MENNLLTGNNFKYSHRINILNLELCKLNNCTVYNLGFAMKHKREKNLQFLRMNHYHAFHHKNPIKIYADGITRDGSDRLMAFRLHRSRTTVEQYLFTRHGVELRHQQLPCIMMRGGNGHESYFPIETLYICRPPKLTIHLSKN